MTVEKEYDKSVVLESISDLWQPLTESQREELLSNMSVLSYDKNETLYAEGDTPLYLACIVSGKVKVSKSERDHTQILRIRKPGELFGFRAFFAHETCQTTASAFERSTIALIPLSLIEKFTNENIEFNKVLIYELAKYLGLSDARCINVVHKHVRGRLAEALLYLLDGYGFDADGYTLSAFLSREELANMSNMTTANAIRTLSAFTQEGIIATDGRRIKILDVARLEYISANE